MINDEYDSGEEEIKKLTDEIRTLDQKYKSSLNNLDILNRQVLELLGDTSYEQLIEAINKRHQKMFKQKHTAPNNATERFSRKKDDVNINSTTSIEQHHHKSLTNINLEQAQSKPLLLTEAACNVMLSEVNSPFTTTELEKIVHKLTYRVPSKQELARKFTGEFAKYIDLLKNLSKIVTDTSSNSKQLESDQFEGGKQGYFLYMQVYSLIDLYFKFSTRLQPIEYRNMLVEEMVLAANSYRILDSYCQLKPISQLDSESDQETGKISDSALRLWVKKFIDELDPQNTAEVSFPCGTQDHAIYLSMYWTDECTLHLRIDNLMKDDKVKKFHNHQLLGSGNKKASPFLVARVNMGQSEDRQKLGNYLQGLIKLRLYSSWKDADVIPFIYQFFNEDKTINLGKTYPPLACQTGDHCIYRNYEAGMRYRLWGRYSEDESQPLIAALWKYQLNWNITKPKEELPSESEFAQYLESGIRFHKQLKDKSRHSEEKNSLKSSNELVITKTSSSKQAQVRSSHQTQIKENKQSEITVEEYLKELANLYSDTNILFGGESFNLQYLFPIPEYVDSAKLESFYASRPSEEAFRKRFNPKDEDRECREVKNKEAMLLLRITYLFYHRGESAPQTLINTVISIFNPTEKDETKKTLIDTVISIFKSTGKDETSLELGYSLLMKGIIAFKNNNCTKAQEAFISLIPELRSPTWTEIVTGKKQPPKLIQAIAYSCLGNSYLKNDLIEAEKKINKAIEIKKDLKDEIELAITQFVKANYLFRMARYDEACKEYSEAYANLDNGYSKKREQLSKLKLPNEHIYKSLIRLNWGNCLRVLGDIHNAELHLRAVEQNLEAILKNFPQHMYRVQCEIALAKLEFSHYWLEESYKKFIKIKKYPNLESKDQAEILYYLAKIDLERAFFDKARTQLQKALGIWQGIKESYPYEEISRELSEKITKYTGFKYEKRIIHSDHSKTLRALGINFYKLGRYEAAQLLLDEVLHIDATAAGLKIAPPNYEDILKKFKEQNKLKQLLTFRDIANIKFRCGYFIESIELLENVLKAQDIVLDYTVKNIDKEVQNPRSIMSREIVETAHCLTRVYIVKSNYPAANDLLTEIKPNNIDDIDNITIAILYTQAELFYHQGQHKEALDILKQAASHHEDLVRQDNIKMRKETLFYARLLSLQAKIYLDMGNHFKALEVAREAEGICIQITITNSYEPVTINQVLSEIYLANHQIHLARKYNLDASRALNQFYNRNPNHPNFYRLLFQKARWQYRLGEEEFYEGKEVYAAEYYNDAIKTLAVYEEHRHNEAINPSENGIILRNNDIIYSQILYIFIESSKARLTGSTSNKILPHLNLIKGMIKKTEGQFHLSWVKLLGDFFPYEASFSSEESVEISRFIKKVINSYQSDIRAGKQENSLLLASLWAKYGLILKRTPNNNRFIDALETALSKFKELKKDFRQGDTSGHIDFIISYLELIKKISNPGQPNKNEISTALQALSSQGYNLKGGLYTHLISNAYKLCEPFGIDRHHGKGHRPKLRSSGYIDSVEITKIPLIKDFYDRDQSSKKLKSFISAGTGLCLITGDAGVGKTQLVIKGCQNLIEKGKKCYLISGESEDTFYSALRNLAYQRKIDIGYKGDDEIAAALRENLSSEKENLLFVFDEVNNLAFFDENLRELFGKDTKHQVIIICEPGAKIENPEFLPLKNASEIKIECDDEWRKKLKEVTERSNYPISENVSRLLESSQYHPIVIKLIQIIFYVINKDRQKKSNLKEKLDDSIINSFGQNEHTSSPQQVIEILIAFILKNLLEPKEVFFVETISCLRYDQLCDTLLKDIFNELSEKYSEQSYSQKPSSNSQVVIEKLISMDILQAYKVNEKDFYIINRHLQKAIIDYSKKCKSLANAYELAVSVLSKYLIFDRRRQDPKSEIEEYWLHAVGLLAMATKFEEYKEGESLLTEQASSLLTEMTLNIGEYYLHYYRDAESAIRSINRYKPKTLEGKIKIRAINLLAYAYYARGQYGEAKSELAAEIIKQLGTFKQEQPNDNFYIEQSGITKYLEAKLLHEADREYEKANEIFEGELLKLIEKEKEKLPRIEVDKGLIYHSMGCVYLAMARRNSHQDAEIIQEKFNKAFSAFEKAREIFKSNLTIFHPFYIGTSLAYAFALVFNKKIDRASAILKKRPFDKNVSGIGSNSFNINSAQQRLVEGFIAYEERDYEKAKHLLTQAIDLKIAYKESEYDVDGLIEAYKLRGRIHLFRGEYKQASGDFCSANALFPESSILNPGKDERLLDLDRRYLANMLLSNDCGHNEVQPNLEKAYTEYKIHAQGNSYHELYVKLYKYKLILLKNTGTEKLRHMKRKLSDPSRFVSQNDKFLIMLYYETYGEVLFKLGAYLPCVQNYQSASSAIERVEQRVKVYQSFHNLMIANCYYKQGNFQECLKECSKALESQYQIYFKCGLQFHPKLAETLVVIAKAFLSFYSTHLSRDHISLIMQILQYVEYTIQKHNNLGTCNDYFKNKYYLESNFENDFAKFKDDYRNVKEIDNVTIDTNKISEMIEWLIGLKEDFSPLSLEIAEVEYHDPSRVKETYPITTAFLTESEHSAIDKTENENLVNSLMIKQAAHNVVEPLPSPSSNKFKKTKEERKMLQETTTSTETTAVQAGIPPAKPFFDNPYSAEAYLAEISRHWPEAFRELCIVSEESQPLIDYITREFVSNKSISSDDVQWLLLCAAYYGSLNQIKSLIQQNFVSAKQGTEKGALTVMHIAALKGDIALIREAKKMFFSIHKAASFGDYQNVTPIHCAIISGNTEALSALDGRFTHVCYTLGSGATDYIELGWLSLAVYAGQLEMLKKLLERYPQSLEQIAFVQGGFGGNILHIAVETFQKEILAALLSHEFFRHKNYLEGTNTHGLTPFALAAQLGNIDAMKILKDKEAAVNKAVQSGQFNSYTALHLAAEAGQHKAVQYLLLWGAIYTAACRPVPKPGKAAREYTAKAIAAKLAKEAAQEADNSSEFTLRRYHIQKSDAYTSIENDLEEFEVNQDITRFLPTSDKKVIYKNLVFKGGGPKGMVYAGALSKLLEKWEENAELRDLSSIERVAGASAGAITAVLLAMGISPKELRSFLTDKENDPKPFLEENSLIDFLSSKPVSKKLLEALNNVAWYALHPLQLGGLFLHLCKGKAFCDGKVFLNWIEKKIKAATGKDWCTFGELKKLVDSQTERKFRHLHVVTIRVSPNTQVEVLSSEDPRYQDYTIAHAIRASMSIPVIFKPAELYKTLTTAEGRRQLVNTGDGLYVDGGVLANYPLKVFDTAGYVYQGLYGFRDEQSKHFPVYNEATLGFYILPEKELSEPVYTKPGKISMYSALQTLYSSAEDRVHEFEQAGRRSIAIGNAGVTLYDFDLKPEQISALYEAGEQAVETSPLITSKNEIPGIAAAFAATHISANAAKRDVEGLAKSEGLVKK